MSNQIAVPTLLTVPQFVDEYGARLGISQPRLYELVRECGLPHVRLGRRVMLDPVEVAAWVRRGGTGSNGSHNGTEG